MASHSINLNDDDMWDDSVLVDSWNEALDEYKKYHSIHAKGGTIKELKALSSRTADEVEAAADSGDATMQLDQGSIQVKPEEQKPEGGVPEAARSAPAISPPQAVLGTVRDENLKKLLMSWYYAGYYTGLYEGQQQQAQQPQ
ncbi:hypothetical protein LMH87_003523 [Akanthomyces muscarius]|uniref:SMN family protein Smn1 n=1 Tax=Akanthomyces muscarius TaxID=2231603 RepID=A0A9W8Q286_AKAMU|nr:hypothetical protein LMH87_003523 [Akanthomyces muscarius]KAJ4144648.1 hypothetical protein LMH87_003523 [Akanthomyces muscarius]